MPGRIVNPEYVALIEFEILTPGMLNWFEITPEIVKEVAASYDTEEMRAPIVLDHMEEGPAYGHILNIEAVDDPSDKGELRLIGTGGVFETGLSLIESGAWPERSICISRWHPYDGIWYLNHLSLLGAGNPAVTAMGPVVILDEENNMQAGAVIPEAIAASVAGRRNWSADEDFIRFQIRSSTRFRDPENFKSEPHDEGKGIFKLSGKLKSSYLPEGFNTNDIFVHAILFSTGKWDLSRAKKWIKSNEKKFKREGVRTVMAKTEDELKAEAVEAERVAAQRKELDDREKAIKDREDEIATERAKIDKDQIVARVESLREAGKIIPAQIELSPVEIACAIPVDAMIGEVSARDRFFEFIEAGTVTKPSKKEVAKGDGTSGKSKGSNFQIGADPDVASAAGIALVEGSDTVLARMNELIADGKSSSDALKQAQKEHREGGSE